MEYGAVHAALNCDIRCGMNSAKKKDLVIAGLTGGIASGKSTVGGMLRDLDVPVVDADRLARDIMRPGEEAYGDVIEVFGKGILDDNGEINRDRLGSAVFGDEGLRRRLEAITHPRIAMLARRAFDLIVERGGSLAVYEAALIVETRLHEMLDCLIVVKLPVEEQKKRLMKRDSMSPEAADARLKAQFPLEKKLEVADYVIDNSGDEDSTLLQVKDVLGKIKAGFGPN